MVKDNIKIELLLLVTTLLVVGAAGYCYDISLLGQVGNLVMAAVGLGGILFRMRQLYIEENQQVLGRNHELTPYEIAERKKEGWELCLCFLIGAVLSVSFPLLPVTGWPYPVLAVVLALFSDSLIGMLGSSLFIYISVTLSGSDFSVFYLYFASSAIAILLFQKVDEEMKIVIPLLVSELCLFLCTTAEILLKQAGSLSFESFIVPILNLFITTLFFLVFMKFYGTVKLLKNQERYLTITDPEYRLMAELKTKSKKSYYLAIHTAYFSDKIAKVLGCNAYLAKAGAYYHRLEDFADSKEVESYETLIRENGFPMELCHLLLMYNGKTRVLESREAGIIYLSDSVVYAMMYIFEKNPDMEVEYDRVIDGLFEKKIKSGILNACTLSLGDIEKMREIFKKESLYYDFLR